MTLSKICTDSQDPEAAVIGCALLSNDALADVAAILAPSHFQDRRCRVVFEAALDLHRSGGAVDAGTIVDTLRRRGALDAVGAAFVADCCGAVNAPATAGHWARRVLHAYQLRRLRDAAGQAYHEAQSPDADPAALAAGMVDQALEAIGECAGDAVSLRDALKLFVEEAEEVRQNRTRPCAPTGLRALDALIGGFPNGALTILGARPHVGKTSLALQAAEATARAGRGVLFISLEMTRAQLAGKAQAMAGGAAVHTLYSENGIPEASFRAMAEAIQGLEGLPVFIAERQYLTAEQAAAMIRSEARRRKLGLVILDYLTLLRFPSRDRWQHIGAAVKVLKGTAQALRLPVVLLAQINRAAMEERDRRPMLHHLRESGDIEQDADLVILLHRPRQHAADLEDPDDYGFAFVDKNRITGRTGRVPLGWNATRGAFEDHVPARIRERLEGSRNASE